MFLSPANTSPVKTATVPCPAARVTAMSGGALLILFTVALALVGTSCNTVLFGSPGAQDGAWTATTLPPGVLGSSTFALRIELDRILQLTVNGADWTVQQSFPASRANDRIVWTAWASPPAGQTGPLPGVPFIVYTFDVALQADGTLSGTVSESGASLIPILGSPFNITMQRF